MWRRKGIGKESLESWFVEYLLSVSARERRDWQIMDMDFQRMAGGRSSVIMQIISHSTYIEELGEVVLECLILRNLSTVRGNGRLFVSRC